MDAGETVSVTLRREFGEEAMNSLDASPKELKKIDKAVRELFKHGIEVLIMVIVIAITISITTMSDNRNNDNEKCY